MTALRVGVTFAAVSALLSGLVVIGPPGISATARAEPSARSAVSPQVRDFTGDRPSVSRASIAFGQGRTAIRSTGRTALGRFVAGIPEDAQARVTVSASVPRGDVTAKDRRVAVTRATAIAGLLRRLPDQGHRISSVRVIAPRQTKAKWTNRVQVTATWGAKAERPGVPVDVQASAGVRSIKVAWAPPANVDRAAPVTYRAYAIEGRERPADWKPSETDPSCAVVEERACDITTVAIGRGYTVAVVASNDRGSSEPSPWPYGPVVPYGSDSSATGTATTPTPSDDAPRSVPGAPGTPAVTAGDTTATLTWTAPTGGGGSITDFRVERSLFDGPFSEQPGCTGIGTALTCTATGLVNGTTARFRVAAINSAGQGDWSGISPAITPYGVPGAPTQPTVIAGVSSAEVFWNRPSGNGSALTGYTVLQRIGAGGSWSDITGACGEYLDYPDDTSCSLTGLTAGQEYFYRVSATNARGAGPESPTSIGVTPTSNSSAPVITSVTPGNTALDIEYTVTASTGETVWSRHSSDDGATWSSWADSASTSGSLTVSSLTNGTTYEVQLGLAVPPAIPTTLVSGTATGRPGTVPGAPTSIAGVARNGYATVSWSAPSNDGGSPLVGYLVEASTTGTGSWLPAAGTCAPSITTSSTATSCNAQGLTNGTAYYFRATARNAFGSGTASSTSSGVTPIGPPDTPAAPTGQGATVTTIEVAWVAPATNGTPVTGYTITRSTTSYGPFATITTGDCRPAATESRTAISCTDTVDSAGPFHYTVTALSAAGSSGRSPVSGAISPLPSVSAPDITAVTPGNGSLSVSFAHSGTATNVQYSTNGGSTWTTRSPASTSSPLPITGLTNGTTYSIALRMVTSTGFSDTSDIAPGTPRTTPSAPAAPTGTAGNSSVSLSWSAPSDDGGAQITGYTVQKSTDGVNYTDQAGCTGLGVDFSCTATGLTSGTAYTFKVAAINAAGTGTFSPASSAITPVAPTCAAGGTCQVGDTGPGGGTVFYVASSPQSWGQYLEVAPSNWSGGTDPRQAWSGNASTSVAGATGTGIGAGRANTAAIIADNSTAGRAATSAAAYTGGSKSDWYLPSQAELVALSTSGLGQPYLNPGYWSSTQSQATKAVVVTMSNGAATDWAKSTTRFVRPIRAFSPVP